MNGLGAHQYGLLSTVGVTLSFFGVLDLGIGAAATRQIAACASAGDRPGVDATIHNSIAFYLAIGVAGAVAMALCANLLVTRVLTIPPALQRTGRYALYLSAAGFPLTLVSGALATVPRAVQRFDIAARVSIALATLSTGLILALVLSGRGILAILTVGLALAAAGVVVNAIVARRLLPGLRVRPRLDREVLRGLFRFGAYFFLSTLAVTLLYQLDKLLVGSILGMAAVTFYVVPGNLTQRIQGFVAAAVSVVFPVSAALFETRDREAIRRLYVEGTRFMFILITSLAVPIAVFAQPFLRHWIGDPVAGQSWIPMMLLAGTYAFLGMTGVAWSIANGAGEARFNFAFTLGIAVVDIGLLLVLIHPFGVTGVAAAYLASAVLGAPLLVSYIERRVIGLSGTEFLRIFWRVGLTGLAQALLGLALLPLGVNLPATLALMVLSVLSFFVLYRAFGFVRAEDRSLISLLTQRLRSGGAAVQPGQEPPH